MPSAVTTISARAPVLLSSTTSTLVLPAADTSTGSKPAMLMRSFAPGAAAISNEPSGFVVAPFLLPATVTLAPATGAPALSVTLPLIVVLWENAGTINNSPAISRSSHRDFRYIQQLFLVLIIQSLVKLT